MYQRLIDLIVKSHSRFKFVYTTSFMSLRYIDKDQRTRGNLPIDNDVGHDVSNTGDKVSELVDGISRGTIIRDKLIES